MLEKTQEIADVRGHFIKRSIDLGDGKPVVFYRRPTEIKHLDSYRPFVPANQTKLICFGIEIPEGEIRCIGAEFKKGLSVKMYDHTGDLVVHMENVTELDWNYDIERVQSCCPSSAFESDIHGDGWNLENDKRDLLLSKVVVEKSTKKFKTLYQKVEKRISFMYPKKLELQS